MSATDGDASHMAADPAPPVPRLQNTKRTGPRSFLQDELLLGCTFHDLNDPASVDATILGAGVDGHVWRVRFGDDETDYALKVFWANRRLEYDHCLGVQHESHNNALLQMIEAAVHETADAPAGAAITIEKFRREQERRRAQEAEEGKEGKESKVGTPESTPDGEENDKYTEVRTVPPFTRCYGWLPFSGQEILKMPQCVRSSPFHTRKLPFRELTTDGEYIALVYEYVPDSEDTEEEKADELLRFLYCTGFYITSCTHRWNWHQGKLVAYSDLVSPLDRAWRKHKKRACVFLRDREAELARLASLAPSSRLAPK